MVDVALVSCPYSTERSTMLSVPLGLFYLKAELARHDISSVVLPGAPDVFDVQETGAKAVGFSATGNQFTQARTFASLVKTELDLPLVVGGYISLIGERLLEATNSIDILYKGEAEGRAGEVFRRVLKGESLEGISGLIYRGDNEIINTGKAPVVQDISRLMPDTSYLEEGDLKSFPITASRGCSNRCSYCFISRKYDREPRREMSAEFLSGEIVRLHKKHGFNFVRFEDDDFPIEMLDDLAEALIDEDLKVTFQTRVDSVLRNRELLTRHAGLIASISVGVESFNDAQLKRWNKLVTREQNLDALAYLEESNIPYNAYLMGIDKKSTPEEVSENALTLLTEENLNTTLLQCFDNRFGPMFNPVMDLYGRTSLSGNMLEGARLLRSSFEQLSLYMDFLSAVRKSDFPKGAAMIDAARALTLTGLDVMLDGSDKAVEDHLYVRRAMLTQEVSSDKEVLTALNHGVLKVLNAYATKHCPELVQEGEIE